jgi:hypothetical protein
MSKKALFFKSMLATTLAVVCTPAFGAEHLDCMKMPMGEPEQAILNRLRDTQRGDNNLSSAVQISLQSRAQACAYLNGWSLSAMRLAFENQWLKVQWGRIPSPFDTSQEERLNVALEPLRPRLIALFSSAVDAVAKGEDPPAPPAGDIMFQDFDGLLKSANIPQNVENKQRLGGWLYAVGFQAAVIAAFSGA